MFNFRKGNVNFETTWRGEYYDVFTGLPKIFFLRSSFLNIARCGRSKGGALFCHSENNDLPHGSVHWCFLYLALQIPCRDKEELLFTVALEKNPWWTFREQWSSKSIQCNALLGGWQAVLVWVRTGFIVIVFMHYTLSCMCMMIFDSKKKYIWNTKVPFHRWGRQI